MGKIFKISGNVDGSIRVLGEIIVDECDGEVIGYYVQESSRLTRRERFVHGFYQKRVGVVFYSLSNWSEPLLLKSSDLETGTWFQRDQFGVFKEKGDFQFTLEEKPYDLEEENRIRRHYYGRLDERCFGNAEFVRSRTPADLLRIECLVAV